MVGALEAHTLTESDGRRALDIFQGKIFEYLRAEGDGQRRSKYNHEFYDVYRKPGISVNFL